MRRNVVIVAAFIAVLAFTDAGRLVWSAGGGPVEVPRAPAAKIGLLDLARVFANHDEFKKLSDLLRADVAKAEEELKRRKAEVEAQQAKLAKLEKGSDEYVAQEEEITRVQAEIQTKVNVQKADFFKQEAQMYLQVYQQIMVEVGKLSRARGINLVMRFNGDPIDPNDPQGIQKELNKAILYHDGIDITDDVLRAVNAKPAG